MVVGSNLPPVFGSYVPGFGFGSAIGFLSRLLPVCAVAYRDFRMTIEFSIFLKDENVSAGTPKIAESTRGGILLLILWGTGVLDDHDPRILSAAVLDVVKGTLRGTQMKQVRLGRDRLCRDTRITEPQRVVDRCLPPVAI